MKIAQLHITLARKCFWLWILLSIVISNGQILGPCYDATSFTSAPAPPLPDINDINQIEIIHPTCNNSDGEIIYKYPTDFTRNQLFISEVVDVYNGSLSYVELFYSGPFNNLNQYAIRLILNGNPQPLVLLPNRFMDGNNNIFILKMGNFGDETDRWTSEPPNMIDIRASLSTGFNETGDAIQLTNRTGSIVYDQWGLGTAGSDMGNGNGKGYIWRRKSLPYPNSIPNATFNYADWDYERFTSTSTGYRGLLKYNDFAKSFEFRLGTTGTFEFGSSAPHTFTGLSAGTHILQTRYKVPTAPNSPTCISQLDVTLTSAQVTPTFSFGPYCAEQLPASWPTTSDNNITGTWDLDPAAVKTLFDTFLSANPPNFFEQSYELTFTPHAGQCAAIVTHDIIVQPYVNPNLDPDTWNTTLRSSYTMCRSNALSITNLAEIVNLLRYYDIEIVPPQPTTAPNLNLYLEDPIGTTAATIITNYLNAYDVSSGTYTLNFYDNGRGGDNSNPNNNNLIDPNPACSWSTNVVLIVLDDAYAGEDGTATYCSLTGLTTSELFNALEDAPDGTSPETGGTWSTSETNASVNNTTGAVTFTQAGTYVFTYSVEPSQTLTIPIIGDCPQADTAQVTVTIEAAPNAGTLSLSNNSQLICLGDNSFSAQTNGDTNGTWTSSDTNVFTIDSNTGAITTVAIGTANVEYTVNATSPCTGNDTATLTINIDPCGFGEFASAVNISPDTNISPSTGNDFYDLSGVGVNLISGDSAGNTFYENVDLGSYSLNSGDLVLNGGEIKIFKGANSDVCSITMYYRVYENGSTPTAWLPIPFDFAEDCVSGSFGGGSGGPCTDGIDFKWTDNPAFTDDLTDFACPGTYVLDFYINIYGTDDAGACDQNKYAGGRDGTNSWFTNTFELTQPNPLSVDISANDTELCAGETLTLEAINEQGGSGSYTYHWTFEGNDLTETGSTLTINPTTVANDGIYSVSIIDNCGDTSTAATIDITINAGPSTTPINYIP